MFALKPRFIYYIKNFLTAKNDKIQKSLLSKISWDELFMEYDDIKQHEKYQNKLSNLEKRDLRMEAMKLDKEKRLGTICVGRPGLKVTIKRKIAKFLERNSFAKIQLVPSCDQDQYQLQRKIEDQLDCVLVYQFGYIMIFYREKGLPISKSLLPVARKSSLKDEEDEDDDLFS